MTRLPGIRAALDALYQMPCECIRCDECLGNGIVYFSFGGRYLGASRCDDLDEYDTCGHCSGSGTTETCDRCCEIEALNMMEQEEEDRQCHMEPLCPQSSN